MVKLIITLLEENKDFYKKIREDFTYHSSIIEGSTVTREDHKKLSEIKEHQTIKSLHLSKEVKQNDAIENLNHLKLFDYVFHNLYEELTHDVVQKYQFILKRSTILHKNIPEEFGKYRITNVKAGNFETTPHYLIHEKMDQLLRDFKIRKPILIDDIAEFHIRYGAIHPFRDGNGRIGRMISFKQCLLNNVVPFIVDKETRQSYIDSVYIGQSKFDYSYLISYYLMQQKTFLTKYHGYLVNQNIELKENEIKIINYLSKNKLASRKKLEKVANLKERAIKSLLKSMINKNLIKIIGGSKNSRYSLKLE
ncbi:MAG: Fic family protein [Mycoplasmataceae bacterium]|jgi:Fic family protein|nr:Fic family protein [Mycoplasmataceae bacterium]